MVTTKQILQITNPKKNKTVDKGKINLDNPRQNIDPHIITNVTETQDLITATGSISETPTDGTDITNKTYVDSQIAGENHWDLTGTDPSYVETYVDNTIISGANLAISGSVLVTNPATGNVGIGTTSPSSPLEIESSISTGTVADKPLLYIQSTANGTTNIGPEILLAGDIHGDGTINANFASIQGIKENADVDDYDAALRFGTRIHTGAITEQMRISSAGNVGIGTTSPTESLTISGSLLFTESSGKGLAYGDLYVDGGVVATTISTQNVPVQIDAFTNAGESNNTTPSAANDEIAVTYGGRYLINCATSFSGGANDVYDLQICKNNGTVSAANLICERKLSANGDIGSSSINGIWDLSAGDTVELWAVNQTAGDDIVVRDANLSVTQIGGS